MGRISLVHDSAWYLSRTVVREFGGSLGDEERLALFRELYRVVRPELLTLLTRLERETKRLSPASVSPPEPPSESAP